MRLIFKNVDTNNTNLKYIIPNDTIIEKIINTKTTNNSKQTLSINQIYDFLDSKFHEPTQGTNITKPDKSVISILKNILYELLQKCNNKYTDKYLGTRLNIINHKFDYDLELQRKIPDEVSSMHSNKDNLKNSLSKISENNRNIISRFFRYATFITSGSETKTTHSQLTDYDKYVFRKMYTIFLDSIPVFDLNDEDFLKETVNSGLNNNTIIYCPETIGDVMFLKNRNELSQINIVTYTNKGKLRPGRNHYITITGTYDVTENQDLKWERDMEFSDNDTDKGKKFNQIEYVVNTLKNQ